MKARFCFRKKLLAILAVTFILALAMGATTFAAGGTLDSTFGINGIVTTQFDGLPSSASDIALQADGRIVILGSRQSAKVLVRYNRDGTLDAAFGVGGIAPIEITSFSGSRIALQTDGKILVGGSSNGRFAVARYAANGSLDTSFGTYGLGAIPSDAGDNRYSPSDLIIQPDGRIMMVGTESNQGNFTNFAVASFYNDGTPNFVRIFDKGDFPNNRYNGASAIAIQADNKIVVSGDMMDNDANQQLTLMRLDQDGWTDKSAFGTNGKGTVLVSIPNFSHSSGALALQPDGKILAAGSIVNDDNKPVDGVLVRLLGNGSLDTSFGGTGIVVADFGANEAFDDFVIQPDGKIIVEGKTGSLDASDFLLVRYNSDGSLDTTFGADGKVVTDLGDSTDMAMGIGRQLDSRVIVVGASGTNAILARYETGSPVTTNTATFKSAGAYDGWILESGENTNKGGTLDKKSNAIFVGDGTKDRQYRGFLSFDTSSIPDDASITGAQVKVKRQGIVGTDPFNTHGSLLLEIRNGTFSNNIALSLADFAVIANIGSTQDPFSGAVDNWHTASLSGINLSHVNKHGTTQFRLMFAKDDNDDMGADYVKFFSGNSSSSQPELVVTYSTSGGAGNQPPVINGGAAISISLPENVMTVTAVTAADPDGQQVSYSISGADAGRFSIDSSTGILTFITPPDFESIPTGTVYHVTAQASDGALTSTQDIAITIKAVNEFAPVITSNGGGSVANISVSEGAIDVTTITATDADLPAQSLEYFLSGGEDWQLFNLDPSSGKLSFVTPPIYNAPNDAGLDHTYNVRVDVIDGELGSSQQLDISVLGPNIPTDEMLDATFGVNGVVTTKFDDRPSSFRGIGLQPDGKVVMLGSAKVNDDNSDYTYRKYLVRYTVNGALDTSFGTNGIALIEVESFSAAAIEVLSDGKILVGGQSPSVVRYNSNGTLDSSFGTNGLGTLDFHGYQGTIHDMAVQPDGKIVLVGDQTTDQANYTEFFIARFTSSGQADNTFVANGFNIIDAIPNYRYAYGKAVVIQADGKIVMSGNMMDNDGKANLALARLNPDGSLDRAGFGTNGRGTITTLIPPDFQTYSGALALQADGRIVVAGNDNGNLILVRYNTNGTLDTTLGGTGIVTTDSGQMDDAYGLIIQPDGKIIVCGTIWNANSKDIMLVRYNADGSLDTSFGINGINVTDIGANNDEGRKIIQQPDGRVIVGGISGDNALLARYAVGAPAATSTLTFKSIGSHDGWILESGENTNKGGTLEKVSNALFVGDDARDRQYRSILSFDTTSIPDDAVIASAQLKIRKQGIVGADPTGTHGSLFLEIRNGTFSNTAALNVEDFSITANIGSTQDTFSATAGDWYIADLSGINVGLVNRYGFTQFRLRFTRDDNDDMGVDYDRFFSGNSETDQPELIVTYSTPGAFSSTPAPTAIGIPAESTQPTPTPAQTPTPTPSVVEPAPATQFTALHQFGSQADNGRIPYGVLVLYNGVFYGTTTYGGPPYNVPPTNPNNKGNIFRMNMDGTGFTVLHEFAGGANDGWKPWAGLAVSNDMIYGSTVYGGPHGENGGVIYEMNVNGSGFRVLHAFGDPGDGFGGSTSPILVGDTLFGITRWGGNGTGTIYSYNTTTEVYKQLHRFAADSSDGNAPLGTLTIANDGYLYGLTWLGGRNNMGTLFRIKPDSSAFETMYHFEGGALGKYPYDNLTFDGDHTLYGTTLGAYGVDHSDLGVIFKYDITSRTYSVLHNFAGGAGDSGKPNGSVVLSSDGVTLYGTTHGDDAWGGSEFGIIYKMNLDGSGFQQLYEFGGGAAGATPMHTPLFINGALYGMTAYGGAENYGLIYCYQTADATLTQKSFSMANLSSPVINSSAEISIAENGVAVTKVTATDADTPTLSYSITGGADAALFAINSSSGDLTFVLAPDFEQPTDFGADNVYNLTVQASDGMLSATQDVSVTVTEINDNVPSITSSGTVSIAENSSAVTLLTATDADSPAQALSYSVIGGADSALFVVNPTTGDLTFISAPDFEQPKDSGADNVYNLTVQVSDGTLTATQDVSVAVTGVNDNVPVFASPANLSTAENITAIGVLTATDADLPAQPLTYVITGGMDAAYFNLNSTTGALSFITAHDYELPNDANRDNIYNLVIQVSDGALTAAQEISVTVLPVNDNAPVITIPDKISVSENALTVATIAATDADRPAQTLTYAITSGADAAKFSIISATGELKFVTAPDFESPTDFNLDNIYEIVIQVSDGTSNVTKNISVQVIKPIP